MSVLIWARKIQGVCFDVQLFVFTRIFSPDRCLSGVNLGVLKVLITCCKSSAQDSVAHLGVAHLGVPHCLFLARITSQIRPVLPLNTSLHTAFSLVYTFYSQKEYHPGLQLKLSDV